MGTQSEAVSGHLKSAKSRKVIGIGKQMTTEDIQGMLILWLVGIAVASFVVLVEAVISLRSTYKLLDMVYFGVRESTLTESVVAESAQTESVIMESALTDICQNDNLSDSEVESVRTESVTTHSVLTQAGINPSIT